MMIFIGYKEKWKKIKYEGKKTKYSISNLGQVRNDKTGRILMQFIQNNGYYGFTISINNKLHSYKTARMVAEYFIPNENPKIYIEVNHKKANSKNNNSEFNLEWVTSDENKNHALCNDLYKPHKGEDNANAIYTNKQIKKLCKFMEKNELDLNELINKSGVDKQTIACIYRGVRWSSISKDYDVRNYDKLPINSSKKHSDDLIRKACELIDLGYSTKEIIGIVNVSKDCVKKLRRGKTFTHISCNYKFMKNKIILVCSTTIESCKG